MKKPPTLADACIASAFDKTMAGCGNAKSQPIRRLFLSIANARKFMLDDRMSEYLADLSRSYFTGGRRKRLYKLENTRHMARLPHALTWIEFSYPHYVDRLRFAHGVEYRTPEGRGMPYDQKAVDSIGRLDDKGYYIVPRVGFLIQQHDKIDTAFKVTEFYSSMLRPDRGMPKFIASTWCSDDGSNPFPRYIMYGEHDASLAVGFKNYMSSSTYFTPSLTPDDVWPPPAEMDHKNFFLAKTSTPLRDLWALLATLNDLPVRIEHVEPSHGFMAKGGYRKFLKHSIVHLTVPETHWRKLVARTADLVRKRAHQVRGHWRNDWHRPLSRLCEHVFNSDMVCARCNGRKLWIHEHQRGDASLGFVTHDYEVHHDIGEG
jgi:hypothetical protein